MATFIGMRALNRSTQLRVKRFILTPTQNAASTATTGGTGLTATTQYFYRVTALGQSGESVQSNEVNVTTGAGATNSNTINWIGVAGAASYRIYRGTAANVENVYYTVAATAPVGVVQSFVDTGATSTAGSPPLPAPVQTAPSTSTSGGTLAAGTYYYKVSALSNVSGESNASSETNLITTGSTSTNTINWTATTGATGYRIYRGTTPGGENVFYTVGAVTTFADTGAASTAGVPLANQGPYVETKLTPTTDVIVNIDDIATRRELSNHRAIGQYIVTISNTSSITGGTLPTNS